MKEKIGIVTFQFAHNYGAMLQAFALKNFIEKYGYDVEDIPYYPVNFQIAYNINPFTKGSSVKQVIKKILLFNKRKKQAYSFNCFKSKELYNGETRKEFYKTEDFKEYTKKFDLLIYGSDQIWNDKIVYGDTTYFGDNTDISKISYAASMGTTEMSDMQKKYFKEFLPKFKSISVREPSSKKYIREACKIDTTIVCDPVFLLKDKDWIKIENNLDIQDRYILLYFLNEDDRLLEMAKKYAKKKNYKIFSIHPIAGKAPKGAISLNDIGPKEFIYYLRNAEIVCTNSFHAVAFSVIFKKKLLHIPNSKSPERTTALLSQLNIDDEKPLYDVDLSKVDYTKLNSFIENSKEFLLKNIEVINE